MRGKHVRRKLQSRKLLLSGIVTARWNTLERREGIHGYVCVLKRRGSCCSTGTSKGTQVHGKNRAYIFCGVISRT